MECNHNGQSNELLADAIIRLVRQLQDEDKQINLENHSSRAVANNPMVSAERKYAFKECKRAFDERDTTLQKCDKPVKNHECALNNLANFVAATKVDEQSLKRAQGIFSNEFLIFHSP